VPQQNNEGGETSSSTGYSGSPACENVGPSDNNSAHKKDRKRKRFETPVATLNEEEPNADGSGTSDSGGSSSSDGEREDEEPPTKKKRFQPMQDESKWEIPKEMSEYLNKLINSYIPDATIKESILDLNPVPTNIRQSFVLDEFLRELLEDNNRSKELSNDDILDKIQKRVINILGPLSCIWHNLESVPINEDNETSITELISDVEKTLTLVGQTVHNIAYQRRHKILSAIMSNPRKVTKMLREKTELLEKEKDALFGSKFEEKMIKTLKSKQKSKDLFKNLTKPSARGKPFRRGSRNQSQDSRGQNKFDGSKYQGFGRGLHSQFQGGYSRGGFNNTNRGAPRGNYRGSYRGGNR